MLLRYFPLLFIVSIFSVRSSHQPVKSDSEGNAVQRFEVLWLVTYIDPNGAETIARAPTPTGEMAPLMAADNGRLQSIIEAGKALAAKRQMTLRLVKFSTRSDIGELKPIATP
jgi:hypothetical protein